MPSSAPIKPRSTDRIACVCRRLVDRHTPLLLAGTLFLALALRIAALRSLSETIYFDYLLWDEKVYHSWALEIAAGTFKSASFHGFAPLPAYLAAFIYKVFAPNVLYIRVLNIVLGVSSCYLVYLIGEEMAGRTTGLIACLVAALYKPFIFYSIVPLKTSLSVFLFALTVYLFLRLLRTNSPFLSFWLGLGIGLMLNVRPNCVVLIPAIPLLIAWALRKSALPPKSRAATLAAYLVGLAVAISPFAVRTYRITGHLSLTTGQAGYVLYLGNNLANPDPYFRPLPFASSSPFEQGTQLIIEASRRAGERLSAREASSYWIREVVDIALEQPAALLWRTLQKILVFFHQFEAGDHYHIGFVSNFATFFRLPLFALWSILPLGMAGMITAPSRSRKLRSIGLIFGLYASTLVLSYTSARFRLPFLVILIPFGVLGLQRFVSHLQSREFSKVRTYAGLVILFSVVQFLPIRATDDMTAYYNTHAVILNSKGLLAEAVQYWEKSSEMQKPYSAYADLALAKTYLDKRDFQAATRHLDKIPADSFAASQKYHMLGDIMMKQQQTEQAIAAYEASLSINSGRRQTWRKLIRALSRTDKQRAREAREKYKYIASFYRR